MTPLQNKIEEAKKRLDKDFQFDGVTYKGNRHWKDGVKQNLVKSFLEQELTSIATFAQEEARKEMIQKFHEIGKQWLEGEGYDYDGSNLQETINALSNNTQL